MLNLSLELSELRRDALVVTIVSLVCTSPLAYLATPLPTFGRCVQHGTIWDVEFSQVKGPADPCEPG